MKKSIRLALLGGACFLGLAVAAPAFSAYDPSLIMEQSSYKLGAATTADVFIAIDPDADPTAKLTIFSPVGYNANLTAAPGTKIGNGRRPREGEGARRRAAARSPATCSSPNPADPTIQAAATQCTGTDHAQHNLGPEHEPAGPDGRDPGLRRPGRAARRAAGLPALARHSRGDRAGRSSARSSFAADFTIKNVFTNAGTNGDYEWSGIFTPYTPGTATPNPAGTLEARTLVGLPSSLTLKRVAAKRGFKLIGQLKIAGVDPKGVRLDLYAGKKAGPGAERRLRRDRQAHRLQRQAAGERQVHAGPAEREVRDLLPDEVRELHDGLHRAVALRPPGSVSPRAHRRGDEQPGQGPEAEAEEEALVRSLERGLLPEAPLSALPAGRRGATTRATSPGSCARRSRRP